MGCGDYLFPHSDKLKESFLSFYPAFRRVEHSTDLFPERELSQLREGSLYVPETVYTSRLSVAWMVTHSNSTVYCLPATKVDVSNHTPNLTTLMEAMNGLKVQKLSILICKGVKVTV
ncbi:hypothetical protein EON65_17780 [archaeon]|nr:MAG: hypothetical protein EON65_17780 [archaeon]